MGVAVGMVESRGLPPTLAAADAMCKAARVTLVSMEKLSGGYYTAVVRGSVSEVKIAVAAGVEAAKKCTCYVEKTVFCSSHIIARPHENVVGVLPIDYTDSVAEFRV
ncbi:carbon dioxide-concentrating protein CcmK [Neosynechococcus sphagnicola sy1]|uniref:Carboxysome shell protein CcmK n=1 Tax=Neosynechococcus sphagnicola sy1 TaxID=1497020 RepID=A0A098THG4_9CYAN|nr:BMC domain-containing protein [Neosynechococcus sphagnicola]KGF72020.1 carbon dioxide-concentrating protein CcmK [Neosynechococcus sphagnicola sy1]